MDHSKSNALHDRALRSIAGGHLSNFKQSSGSKQLYFQRFSGCRMFDVDGNMYVDWSLASGPCILGHSNEALQQALTEQLQTCYVRAYTQVQIEAAELFCQYVPCADRMHFSVTGGENILYCLRLARAYTGKNMVVRMLGQYNGGTDIVFGGLAKGPDDQRAIDAYAEEDIYSKACYTQGRARHALDDTYLVEFNDLAALERLFAADNDIACLLMEPVALNLSGCMAQPEYLQGARALCDKYGVLLIFDETLTGFRIGLYGAQGYYGILPDLAAYAKAIGGGFPVAAFGGKKEIMDVLASGDCVIPGTYNGNCLAAAAMKATISTLGKDGGAIYEQMNRMGNMFREGVLEAAARHGVPMIFQGFPTALFPVFTEKEVIRNHREALLYSDIHRMHRFSYLMKENGVIGDDRYCVSAAHSEEDVQCSIEAADKALAVLAAEG